MDLAKRIVTWLKITEAESEAGARFFTISFILITGVLLIFPFEYARWIALITFIACFAWFVFKVR